MQGRLEKEILSEKRVRKKLLNELPILTYYYNAFDIESYTTKEKYINYIIDFINFIKQYVELTDGNSFNKITSDHIRAYMHSIEKINIGDNVKLNGESIRATRYSGINNFFDFLLHENYIDINPCTKVKRPQIKKDIEIVRLKQDEINILLNNIKAGSGGDLAKERQKDWKVRDLALIILGLTTGLRVEALVDINIEDVDFIKKTIRVIEKGNKNRIIYISDVTLGYLKDWYIKRTELLDGFNDPQALFISNRRIRISTQAVRKLLQKYTYNIDKHITPHKMRSTFATNVYSVTGDIYATANALGHSSPNSTRRYTLIEDEKKREIANIASNFVI